MSQRRFRRTPAGVSSLGLPVVWCLQYRGRILGGRVAARCGELLGQIAEEHCGQIVADEVVPDHVRLFVWLFPSEALAVVVRAFEGRSARVLRHEFRYLWSWVKVLWSPSYFAASVGSVSELTVRCCIGHQWDAVGAS